MPGVPVQLRGCATLQAPLYTERAVPGEVAERLKALAC
jgi:hypothetical protein